MGARWLHVAELGRGGGSVFSVRTPFLSKGAEMEGRWVTVASVFATDREKPVLETEAP